MGNRLPKGSMPYRILMEEPVGQQWGGRGKGRQTYISTDVGEMVQINQKLGFFSVLGHLGTPKWTQKGTQRPASERDVWPNVSVLK